MISHSTFPDNDLQRLQRQQQPYQSHNKSDNEINIEDDKEQQGYTEFFSWGNDEDGQLGHGQEDVKRNKVFNLPKSLSFEVLILQISCGVSHTSFISSNSSNQQGYVFSFGNNTEGQLGIGDSNIHYSTAPLLVSELVNQHIQPSIISCGGYHSAIVSTQGDVYLWGRNNQGQCGKSSHHAQSLFAPQKLQLETQRKIQSIDCGDQHTAFISTNKELFTFGDNQEGQLGIGLDYKQIIDRPTLVIEISEEIIQVSCGFRHTLVLTENGKVFGMGTNRRQEIGLGNTNLGSQNKISLPARIQALEMYMITKVAAGGFSMALTTQNEILVWGAGEFGQLSTPQKIYMDDIRFFDISISKTQESFASTIDNDGFLYTWGQNQHGQLGLGDFRNRKLPTKVPQLRKKKIRQANCGGSFIIALGKDVINPKQQQKVKQPKKQDVEQEYSSQRTKSQINLPSEERRNKAIDQPNQYINERPRDNRNNASFDSYIPAQRKEDSINPYQQQSESTKSAYKPAQYPSTNRNKQIEDELSQERIKRNDLERDIKDKEYEIVTLQNEKARRNQLENQLKDKEYDIQMLQNEKLKRNQLEQELKDKDYQIQMLQNEKTRRTQLEQKLKEKDYEIRRLHQSNPQFEIEIQKLLQENDQLKNFNRKESENSYKVLQELEQTHQENNILKNQLDEKQRELKLQRDDILRSNDKIQTLLQENEKLKKDNVYLVSRTEDDIQKMHNYLTECEQSINDQKDRTRELERQLLNSKDSEKQLNQALERKMQENGELLRQNQMFQDKIKQLVSQLQQSNKENEDIKYDNTILFEKNVEKDARLLQQQEEIKNLCNNLDQTKQREMNLDKELRKMQKENQDYRYTVQNEEDKNKQRNREIEDLQLEREHMKQKLEEQLSGKCLEYDNLKRGYDKLIYEAENLRKMLNAKQDEIGQQNDLLQEQMRNRDQLIEKVQEMDGIIKDVEEKNKRLVDLLNANIYNKAEQYKEKVLSKLQERNLSQSNNNRFQGSHYKMPTKQSEMQFSGLQPSPIRLQKILSDEKQIVQKDRERLQKVAESINKKPNQEPTVGGLSSQLNQVPSFSAEQFHQKPQISPYQKSGYHRDDSPTQATIHGGSYPQGFGMGPEGVSRLRISDLYTPSKFGYESVPNTNMSKQQESSPERIADILKQSSPVRRKIATDSLQPTAVSHIDESQSPYEGNYDNYDNQNEGGIAASKIAHTLVNGQLQELRSRLQNMQRDKEDLDSRLQNYESQTSQYR